MTVTEPTEPAPAPAFRSALRHIASHGKASLCCVCGHCLPSVEYSNIERALDACLTHMLDMVGVIGSCTSKTDGVTWLSLRVLHELVDDARKLLCVQRVTERALASFGG